MADPCENLHFSMLAIFKIKSFYPTIPIPWHLPCTLIIYMYYVSVPAFPIEIPIYPHIEKIHAVSILLPLAAATSLVVVVTLAVVRGGL